MNIATIIISLTAVFLISNLHNSFTDGSMVMKGDIREFARMFASLSEYFQRDRIKI